MTLPRTGSGSALHRGALVVVVSAVAGLLFAGLAFPLVGGFGMLARAGAESFDKLPADLREEPLPQRSRILAADGSTLAHIYLNENRIMVPFREIPDDVVYSILAIEDSRFYEHNGVDVRGLVRAFVRNQQAGGVTQGGSTITQQYVKNVLVENADDKADVAKATERSTQRKIREARYAIALERRYTKQQILEKYLNIAYFGDGVYGVGTAAQHYFRKRVQRLTLPEAALLAGMVKNPQQYNPVDNPKAAKARRDLVLRRAAEVGFVDAQRVAKALKQRMPKLNPQKLTGIEDHPRFAHFLRYMREYFQNDPRFGATEEERIARLFQGGLVIQTTLDPKLQQVAQETLDRTLPFKRDPAAAVVVVKPGTGEVRAMASVNHDPKTAKVNLATGGSEGFQAGSTFKTFTLAAAVEQGLPLSLKYNSPARYRPDPRFCDAPQSGAFRNAGDSEAGRFDLPTATWMSVNTYYLQLQEQVGVQKVVEMARRMGIEFPADRPVGSRECSLTLGGREASPLTMAAAYATFAAGGVYCQPTPIAWIQAPGEPREVIEPECRGVVDRDVANTVSAVLRGVIDGPHPHRTGKAASLGRPAAGKTGTTNGPTAAWFDGYTPDFAAAVWMGHPTAPAQNPLRNVHGVRVVYGGSFPAQMWRQIMLAAHQGLPVRDFDPPSARGYLGEQVTVPDLRGMTPEDAERVLAQVNLRMVVIQQPVSGVGIAAGLIGSQSPGPNRPVTKGTVVAVRLSDGTAPRPRPPVLPSVTASPAPSPTPTATPAPTRSPKPPSPSPSPSCRRKTCQSPSPSPTRSPSPTPTPTPSGGGGG
ncbi:MAG TPA: transglycosylase domain-containing protein [Frankiaceae bacterium]|nr:transglycosylase domain-containing protein [Frankiaceae bacterium]